MAAVQSPFAYNAFSDSQLISILHNHAKGHNTPKGINQGFNVFDADPVDFPAELRPVIDANGKKEWYFITTHLQPASQNSLKRKRRSNEKGVWLDQGKLGAVVGSIDENHKVHGFRKQYSFQRYKVQGNKKVKGKKDKITTGWLLKEFQLKDRGEQGPLLFRVHSHHQAEGDPAAAVAVEVAPPQAEEDAAAAVATKVAPPQAEEDPAAAVAMEAALAAKMTALAAREAALTAKETEVEAALAEREAALAAKVMALAEREAAWTAKAAEVEEALAEREAALTAKATEVDEALAEKVAAVEEALAVKEGQLQTRIMVVAYLEHDLRRGLKKIKEMNKRRGGRKKREGGRKKKPGRRSIPAVPAGQMPVVAAAGEARSDLGDGKEMPMGPPDAAADDAGLYVDLEELLNGLDEDFDEVPINLDKVPLYYNYEMDKNLSS